MNAREIQLWHYDYEKKERVEDGTVSIYPIAMCMTNENMTQLLDNHLNRYNNHYKDGLAVGKMLHHVHRTGQGNVGRWALGVLIGLGEQEYTDHRNEAIVAFGKELKRMIDRGELNMGYMI
jgi:hypothetical protein